MIKSSLKYLLILTIGGVIPAAHLNADTTQSNYSKMHSSHHGEHMSISGEMASGLFLHFKLHNCEMFRAGLAACFGPV